MKKLFTSLNRFNAILLFAGIAVIFIFFNEFVCSFKPIISFEDLLDGVEVKSGSHIEGNVVMALPPFASETTETSKFGTTISTEDSGNYYLVPMGEGNFIGLKTKQSHVFDIDKLVEETLAFYDGGDQPTTKVFIEGMVKLMDDELIKFFSEFMISAGFTEAEFDAMGTPLYIDYTSFNGVRITFIGGIVSVILGAFLIFMKYRKLSQNEQSTEEKQSGLEM
jgi:hypothetical protein